MKKETLLEKAKNVDVTRRSFKKVSDEHIELAIAWAKDEIALKQVSFVLFGNSNTSKGVGGKSLYYMAVFLREGFRKGILKAEAL